MNYLKNVCQLLERLAAAWIYILLVIWWLPVRELDEREKLKLIYAYGARKVC